MWPDLAGKKIGRLTVLAKSHSNRRGRWWKCRCECGNGVTYSTSKLQSGHVWACGCLHGAHLPAIWRQHGKSSSPTYDSWYNMMRRCRGDGSKGDRWYANKGIKVCARWVTPDGKGFRNFLADMGERPAGMSLDRINSNGNYGPSNCRWATPRQQAQNRSNVKLYEYNGKRLCIMDWLREITGKENVRAHTELLKS